MKWIKVKLTDISKPKQWKNLSMSELDVEGFSVYGANGVIGKYREYNHELPTLAITCRGATCGTINITEPKAYITSNAMALDDLDHNIDQKFLYFALVRRGFKDVISGSAQPQITREGLKNIVLDIPESKSDQIYFANLLTQAENLIAQRKESIRLLDELLKSTFLEMFGDPVRNDKCWKKKQLGEIAFIKHGFAFKSEFFLTMGEYILLTPGNFYEEGGYKNRKEKQKYYCGEFPKEYLLNKGDLLIAMTEQAPGLLGSPIIIPESNIFLHNQRLGLVVFDNTVLINWFLFYLFNYHKIRTLIHSKATGTKVRHTSPTKIQEIRIGIPPIELQIQFAQIVESTEVIKAQYQSSLQELESLYGSLSQRAFKGELKAKDGEMMMAAEAKVAYQNKTNS